MSGFLLHRYRLIQSWTLDHDLIARAVDRLGGFGGTALLDESGRALLETVAGATGGQVLSLPDPADLAAAFREVLDAMRRRYLLVFEPRDSKPGWHRLEVRLARNLRAKVRARSGYFLN